MNVGILQLDLKIGDALNLKEKGRIVKSLKDRWRHHHNVSVAEVDFLDHPQHAMLGVVMAGSDVRHLESSLSRIVEQVRHDRVAELLDYQIEIL